MEGMFIKGYFAGIINKCIGKFIKKKLGYDPGVIISNFEVSTTPDELVKVNLSACITKDQFNKLIEEVML